MKHASEEAIERLSELLAEVRALPGLTEKKPGVYYRKSRAFLHFHEDGDQLFADVRLSGPGFERLPSTTKKEQAVLLKAMRKALQ